KPGIAQKVNVRRAQALLPPLLANCCCAVDALLTVGALFRICGCPPALAELTNGLALFRVFRSGPMGHLHAFRQNIWWSAISSTTMSRCCFFSPRSSGC